MAGFTPSKKYPSDFNRGVKYKSGDAVQAKTVNDLVESALWVQELAFSGGGTIIGGKSYDAEISSTSTEWTQYNGFWQIKILQVTHNIGKITGIDVEKKVAEGEYENMVYSYKRYSSGSVAIIVDEKIDIRIIIKGE